jgi:uncharacterized protein YcbK (DUF882 family)
MPITFTEFCEHIRTLCRLHDASVTSWFRTSKRNAAKGGKPRSKHRDGFATDLVPDDPTEKPALVTHARQLGLTAVDEDDHVHVQVPAAQHTSPL